MTTSKICKTCGVEKSLELFHKSPKSKLGVMSSCKKCAHQYLQEKRKDPAQKEKHKEYGRRSSLKSRYGITIEDYDELYKLQNGLCKICKSTDKGTKRLSVDHNHESGKVRGLLCQKCNRGLGLFNDSIFLFTEAIKYIKETDGYETK
jgi:hypothetical protein